MSEDAESKIKKIHMGRLEIFELDLDNNRSIQQKLVDEYARTIALTGVDKPLLVRLNKATGKYTVMDGSHRILAAQKVAANGGDPGWIKYEIDNTITDESRRIIMLRRNTNANLTIIDEAEIYSFLIAKGYTQAEIAKQSGKTASHISQILPLANAPKSLKTLAHDDIISPTLLRHLINHFDSNWQKVEESITNIIAAKKIELQAKNPDEQAVEAVAEPSSKKKSVKVTEKDLAKAEVMRKHSRTFKTVDKYIAELKSEKAEKEEIERMKIAKRIVELADTDMNKLMTYLKRVILPE